jgi:ABC-type arginine transport system ATPase subunit
MIMSRASKTSPIDYGTQVGKAKVAMRLKGLRKTYPGATQPAVQDLSLDLYDGEIVTLLGQAAAARPPHCAWPRVSRCLTTAIFFWRHRRCSEFASIVPAADKRNVGMVFQSYAIWPHVTVATAWASDWSAKALNE